MLTTALTVSLIVFYSLQRPAQCLLTSLDAANTTSPVNVTSTVSFTCQTNNTDGIRWGYVSPTTNTAPHIVFIGLTRHKRLPARFSVGVDSATGESKLTIAGVQSDDAGVYSCMEMYDTVNQIRFKLLVVNQSGSDVRSSSETDKTAGASCGQSTNGSRPDASQTEAERTTMCQFLTTSNSMNISSYRRHHVLLTCTLVSVICVLAATVVALSGVVCFIRRGQRRTFKYPDVWPPLSTMSRQPDQTVDSATSTSGEMRVIYSEVKKVPRANIVQAVDECKYAHVAPRSQRVTSPPGHQTAQSTVGPGQLSPNTQEPVGENQSENQNGNEGSPQHESIGTTGADQQQDHQNPDSLPQPTVLQHSIDTVTTQVDVPNAGSNVIYAEVKKVQKPSQVIQTGDRVIYAHVPPRSERVAVTQPASLPEEQSVTVTVRQQQQQQQQQQPKAKLETIRESAELEECQYAELSADGTLLGSHSTTDTFRHLIESLQQKEANETKTANTMHYPDSAENV